MAEKNRDLTLQAVRRVSLALFASGILVMVVSLILYGNQWGA